MNHWILKSEPSTYSFDDLLKDKKTVWDGIRNYQARNFLRTFKVGDFAVIYHSGDVKAAVGIAKVTRGPFDEPCEEKGWVAIEIAPLKALKRNLPLAQLKADKILKSILLVRHSRISVSPVTKDEYDRIIELTEGQS